MQSIFTWAKDVLTLVLGMAGVASLLVTHITRRAREQDLRDTVLGALGRHRDETKADTARLERGLAGIRRFLAALTEQRVDSGRWQGRVDMTLEGFGRRLDQLEGQVLQQHQQSEAA